MKLYFLILILIFAFSNYLRSDDNISLYQEKQKIKILNKKDFALRIYIFMNTNSCDIMNTNISRIESTIKNFKAEIVLVLSGLNQADAENYIKKYEWNFEVIGDKYNVYTEYFKVKYTPCIYLLNNKGELLKAVKLGSRELTLNQIYDYAEAGQKELSEKKIEYLKEIKRVNVKNDSIYFVSGIHRDFIYCERSNEYYFRNNTKPTIYNADSNGKIIKKTAYSNNKNLDGYISNYSLFWAKKDSVFYLSGKNSKNQSFFQFYDVINDSVSKSVTFNIYDSAKVIYPALISTYNTNEKYAYFGLYLNDRNSRYLSKNYKVIYKVDSLGNLVDSFSSPDTIFSQYKMSTWFNPVIYFDNKNNELISFQNNSDILRKWTSSGQLKSENKIYMGQDYKVYKKDISSIPSKEEVNQIHQNRSKVWRMLIDDNSDVIAIPFTNEIFPEGVIDGTSPEIIIESFVVFINNEGKNIYNRSIKLPNTCIPFYIKGDKMLCTELDADSRLQIVEYKIDSALLNKKNN